MTICPRAGLSLALLTVALPTFILLSAVAAPAASPTLEVDPAAYLHYVQSSPSPEAARLRREIADGPAALARERAGAQAEGLPISLDQLAQPMPPDDQNAAPLYQKLDAVRRAKMFESPLYAQPLTARYAYTPEQLDRVQKAIDARPDVFALLHQAADRPQCVFPHDWAKEAFTFPREFQGLRESAREIKTESVLLAERGRYTEAVQAQTRGYRVAEHAASGPTLVSYLVGDAVEAITTSGMGDILALAGPNADVAELVRRAVSEHAPHLSPRRGLASEVAFQEADFALLRGGSAYDFQVFANDSDTIPRLPRSQFTPDERRTYRNLLDAAEADTISRLRRVVAAEDTPGEAAAFAQSDQEAADGTDDPARAIANKLSPFRYVTLTELAGRAALARRVVLAAAAVLAVRAKTGAYPDTLPETYPDQFHGGALIYRREGTDGFGIYTTDPDGGGAGTNAFQHPRFRYPAPQVPVPKDEAARRYLAPSAASGSSKVSRRWG